MAYEYVSYLFGGSRVWDADEWTDSDDRVRGGISQSHLTIEAGRSAAVFHGTLDTKALGGAGFASQRTKDGAAGSPWDLSPFDALRVRLRHEAEGQCDNKKYTLVLKDEILPSRPDGRESSSVSWEAQFSCPAAILATGHDVQSQAIQDVVLPWASFVPFYRGKPKEDAAPLNLESIKRISIMMRSFFDEQHGEFSITIDSIAAMNIGSASATNAATETQSSPVEGGDNEANHEDGSDADSTGKKKNTPVQKKWRSLLRGFCCGK